MPSYIETYNHQNRIGAIVELDCQDAYTLRTEEFRSFAADLAQHLAAVGETDQPLELQSYYKDSSVTIGARMADLQKELGVRINVTRYECFSCESIK